MIENKVDAKRLQRAHTDWEEADYAGPCPVRDVLDRVGDRWSVLVVLRLSAGATRFRVLLRSVEGISQRMLTVTLRALERDGLVHRQVFDTRPPSVEYSLTKLGESLLEPLSLLAEWAMDNHDQVLNSRKTFDR